MGEPIIYALPLQLAPRSGSRAARALRDAHVANVVDAFKLDLALYQVGNVSVRALGWPAEEVVDQLDDIGAIFGNPLLASPEWLHDAARLAEAHQLTFYDASWAAAARGLGVSLVSTDRQLLGADLAESPTAAANRLGLRIPEDPLGSGG